MSPSTRHASRVLRWLYVGLAAACVLALLVFVVPRVWPEPAPDQRQGVEVKRVIDGDTLVVQIDGHEERVRLIGIDTPETTQGKHECAGEQAAQQLRWAIDDQPVTLVIDETQGLTDRYGRQLRYVEVGGQDVGELLLRKGLAREYTYRASDPYARQDRYRAAQGSARADGDGGWYACQW